MHKCTKLLLQAAVAVIYLVSADPAKKELPQYLYPPRPYVGKYSHWDQGRVFGDDEESLVKELQVTMRQLRAAERHHYAPFLYRPVNKFEDIVRHFFRRGTADEEETKRLEEFYTMNERCTALCLRCMYHMTAMRKNKTFDFGAGVANYFPRHFSEFMPPGYKFRRMRLD